MKAERAVSAQCAGHCRRPGGRTRSLWATFNDTVLRAVFHWHICSRAQVFMVTKAKPPLHASILQLHSHAHQGQPSQRACGKHIRPSTLHRACLGQFHRLKNESKLKILQVSSGAAIVGRRMRLPLRQWPQLLLCNLLHDQARCIIQDVINVPLPLAELNAQTVYCVLDSTASPDTLI